MQIEIFDVGHGHCSVVTAPNGTRLMLDCGTRWGDNDFWTPSLHYFGQGFPVLAPLNLDEDHLADFGGMLKNCGVKTVFTNLSIGPREFIEMKSAGRGVGADAYLAWLSAPKSYGMAPSIDFGPVQIRAYNNAYGAQFKKSNDLSLAVFVQYGSFKILFAGDLENAGWCGLLANPSFVAELHDVSVFVASHHGRRNGCHEALFKLMAPAIIVISDDEKQHETQETHAWYHWRCTGIPVMQAPTRKRHVYTTRSDGNMKIDVQANGNWLISHGLVVRSWPKEQKSAAKTLLG